MARARSSGGGGLAVALVLVSVLFFICMILAILLYTQLDGAREAEKTAKSDLKTYVRANEKDLPPVQAVRQDSGQGSVIGQLLAKGQLLRELIAGDPDATVGQIESQLEPLELEGRSLVLEIGRLKAELDAAQKRHDELQSQLDDVSQDLEKIQEGSVKLREDYGGATEQLKGRVAKLRTQGEEFRDKVDAEHRRFEDQIEQVQRQRQTEVNELNSQLREQRAQIARLQRKVKDLQRQQVNPDSTAVNPARQADGRVVSIIQEENLVYIDVGREGHILLGLTFEVFDARRGVLVDATGELRGKATVEVVNVLDQSSVCRIVRSDPGQTVNDGDVIANVVYDPDVTYKFLVYGDFDIDHIGIASSSDRKRVETLIERWGGRLTRELTYDVDFLVLGVKPPIPTVDSNENPIAIAEAAKLKQRYDEYQQRVKQAQSLTIPILNQNRFLALVGYYRR